MVGGNREADQRLKSAQAHQGVVMIRRGRAARGSWCLHHRRMKIAPRVAVKVIIVAHILRMLMAYHR